MKDFKLKFNLIPSGAFNNNLRALFSRAAWDYIRKDAYERANHRCSVCGAPSKRLEAHEVWEFDEKNMVQRLKDVIAVCPACHGVIHINRTQAVGREDGAIKHFMKVNGATFGEYIKELDKANLENKRLSRLGDEWSLDLTWLKRFLPDDSGEKSGGGKNKA